MSGLLVGLVLEHLPATDAQQLAVAVVLADAADHDGSHIFPSVARVARFARTSERTVQRVLSAFRDDGFLKLIAPGGGRGRPAEYCIDVVWLKSQPSVLNKGDCQSPFQKRVTGDPETPTKLRQCGDKTVTKPRHSCVTQPVDPPTVDPPPTTTGGGEVPQEILAFWERAAALEAEIEEKQRPIRNHAGFQKAILARYRAEGGPEKVVLAELDRRDRKAGHLEEKQLQQLIGKTLKIASTGETMRILREGGVVLMRFGAASAPLVPGNVELKRLLEALGAGSVVEVEKA